MLRRNRLAWQLSVPVLVMFCGIIIGAVLLGNHISRQFAIATTRDVMEFYSASIRRGIEKLMMSGDVTGAAEFIEAMSRKSARDYNIGLISHPRSKPPNSTSQLASKTVSKNDSSCSLCHVTFDEVIPGPQSRHEIIEAKSGVRQLHVVTPITNKQSCRTKGCHAHEKSGSMLGFLSIKYSHPTFEDPVTGMSIFMGMAMFFAICLTAGVVLLLVRWLLATPLRHLMAGIGTLGTGDFGFRFAIPRRSSELTLVEDSFNKMAARIQTQRRELRDALEYLGDIIENTADLIITVNPEGRIQTFNHGAEQALGFDRKEVVGRKMDDLFADPRERDLALTMLEEMDHLSNWETRFKTKNGQIRYVLLTISRLRDPLGNAIGTLGISKNITVEKELNERLMESEKAAAIGRALTAIQHAIKNMLNTMAGGVYIARVGIKNEKRQMTEEGCDMIDEGLARIGDLSKDMLRYAKKWTVESEEVNLVEMLKKLVASMTQPAKDKGVVLKTDLDTSIDSVSCDPRLIHMCLMDIISNALDACAMKDYGEKEQPNITVRLYKEEDSKHISIEFEDNGIGMTEDVQKNIFTPFYTTKKKMGTGLGLAQTSRLIDLHHGRLDVKSEPEVGSVFQISLPIDGRET